MATNLPYNDSVFLFRLQALIIDGGTEVVRNIFNTRLNNQSLVTFLTNEKAKINPLRVKKTIRKVQYDQLFPPGGQNPDSKDFDITLLMCLLRNIPSLGLNMNYPWHIPPAQSDNSTEADLSRLQTIRNEIAHASSTHCLDEPKYKRQWNEMEQCLLRLNSGPPSIPNLQATIDSFKNSPLDPATEKRLDKQWQELENFKESEINIMKEGIDEVKGEVGEVKGDVGEVKGDISNLKRGIGKVEGDVDKASEDICEVKGSAELLVGRVNNLEEQVQNLDTKLSVKTHRIEDVTLEDKLQEVLIETYRSDHSKMNLAPLLNKDTPLLQFYQMPDLERVTERIELGRPVNEVRTPIDTWEKLFHDSNQSNHRSIYICADAGLGKTAFSKYLARAWCQSKKQLQEESEFFKPEQLVAIGNFRFVFLLFLRESQKSNLCHLKDMIWEQLVSKLLCSNEIKDDLENFLRNEKCLIILDGLDEWIHPPTCGKREQVPHWSERENVAVITTTRPWKFNDAGLKSGQIDHRIELKGLNQASAYNLKYSCLSYFKMQQLKVECLSQQDINEVHSSVEKFTRTVSDKHAWKLESVPLMLMYMLFLYVNEFRLGETQCDLYCQIIELLLSRTFEEKQKLVTSAPETIPPCFDNLKHCLTFYNPYLKPLGELAFKTLLEEKREENTLVFDSSVAIKCLGEECFNICLKTGIISQSKCVQTRLLIQKSTVSFSHKTMQEFFAALYMYSDPDDTKMSQLVLSKCKNVHDILDMSKIIMFISGMNVNVAALISSGMMNIINECEITQKFRNTTEIWILGHPLQDLQNMFVSCCKEMKSGDNLYIQDVFIESRRAYDVDEQYHVNLKQLIQNNRHNIKSVNISLIFMDNTPYNSVQKVVEYFMLKDLKNLVKISCQFGKDTENIIPVLNTQVKCLELRNGESLSRSLCDKVTSLQKLECIDISMFTISHSELKSLLDVISQKVAMRQIELLGLHCSEHWRPGSCQNLSLDLSQHSQLRKLSLTDIPLSELNIKMTSLERCKLESLSLSSPVFTHGTCDTVNNELCFVSLTLVTIPASVLKDLVTVIETLPHTVCVQVMNSNINPESEWQTLKQQIKTSPHFTVLQDGKVDLSELYEQLMAWGKIWYEMFEFQTIKHGN